MPPRDVVFPAGRQALYAHHRYSPAVRAEGFLIAHVVREELRCCLQTSPQRQDRQGRDDFPWSWLLGAYLRPYRVVETVVHLLLPFVLMAPFAVTLIGSPTVTRLRRRAVASSTGKTMTSSPCLSRARACPSI